MHGDEEQSVSFNTRKASRQQQYCFGTTKGGMDRHAAAATHRDSGNTRGIGVKLHNAYARKDAFPDSQPASRPKEHYVEGG